MMRATRGEEDVKHEVRKQERSCHLFTLSAKSERALRQAALNLKQYLEQRPPRSLGDLAYTLHVGRHPFDHRLALAASSVDELIERAAGAADPVTGLRSGKKVRCDVVGQKKGSRVAFLFTGQGAQYGGMGRELYETSSVYQKALEECAEILAPQLPVPLLDYLFDPGRAEELNETHITQPTLFALEYALAQLWMSWGIRPSVVIGHSLGEYVAACVAGALTLRDALRIVAERGRLMQELCERGAMVSVKGTEGLVAGDLADYAGEVSISAVNASDQIVVAGRTEAIEALCEKWERSGMVHKRLPVSHAFHSPLMEPMVDEFVKRMEQVEFRVPRIPVISNLTGNLMQEQPLDAAYWAQHLRQPVQFAQGLDTLLAQEDIAALVEIGPHPVLKRLADRAVTSEHPVAVVASLQREEQDWAALSDHLGHLWTQGIPVDWKAFDADYKRKRVSAPTYPFDEKSYWLEADRTMMAQGSQASSAMPIRKESERTVTAETTERTAQTAQAQKWTNTERMMVDLWKEVLGVREVHPADDFFDLGGDSLNVIQMQTRLSERTGARIEFQAFFRHSTIQEMVALVGKELGDARTDIPSVGPQPHHPLSPAQRRMWVLEQFGTLGDAYNIPNAVRIRGPLQPELLERSLNAVIKRHDALRTTFTVVDGEPVQIISPEMSLQVQVTDLQASDLDARIAEEGQHPFDLTKGPLVRATLLRLGAEEHVLTLVMHHIVSDGWSMGVLVREILACYEAFAQGQNDPLAPLPIQYADYAHWQQSRMQGDEWDKQLLFWQKQLAGTLPVLDLPTDRPRQNAQEMRGAAETFALTPDLSKRLEALSRRTGTTLNTVLLAAFHVLLHRSTSQEDILVGTPIAGRTHSRLEALIGVFINTLVLRTNVSGDLTFRQLVENVHQVTTDAFAHADVPFEVLANELATGRQISQTPLFQVMFVLQNAPSAKLETQGLSLETLPMHNRTAKFELTMLMEQTESGLGGTLEYSTDLFDRETILRMIEQFLQVLEAAADDPERTVAGLPMLTERERQLLLKEWNGATADFPSDLCLHHLFEQQAERYAERVAVTYEDHSLTYAELNRRANQLAHHLQRKGVRPGMLVGLAVERSPELVIGILGILKAGGAYLPLDPAYPQDRLAFMAEDSGMQVLVTEQRLLEQLPPQTAVTVRLDADAGLIAQESGENPTSAAASDSLAYVIYTSGSTGKPKGVLIPHANVTRLFAATEEWYQFDEHDVWTLFHSYAFDFSVWELWGALLCGGRLVVVPYWTSRSAEEFHHLLFREKVTVLNQTPSAFRQLIRADENAGEPNALALRYVILGGEALELSSLLPWMKRHGDQTPQIVNMYGITETTVHVTYRPLTLNDLQAGNGSVIGCPIPDLEVYVLDPYGQPAPIGVTGELHVGGAGVADGYLNRPDLTAERFVPHPFSDRPGARLYKTGDLARFRRNGELEYMGRIDQQVKIRGFRIELGEIEAVLLQHPAVREAVVTAREEETGDKRLAAYYVPRDGEAPSAADLRRHIGETLPDYMVPSAFAALDAFPLTANGKVDLRALPQPEEGTGASAAEYVAPGTPLEITLAGIWAELLRVERVGVQDDFFELGGHSLLGTQLMTRVQSEFGVQIPLRELFEIPTIAHCAACIEAATAPKPASPMRIEKRSREDRRVKR